jgi:hypothetical protein
MFSSVDLPQPDAPTMHTSSPASTTRSMPSMATVPADRRVAPKRLIRPLTSSLRGSSMT